MVDFGIPEHKFLPEIDEQPITMENFKKIIEELEIYNKDSRLWKKYDSSGGEIPERYRGRNRYWVNQGEGNDETIGPYTLISIYDLDPEAKDGRRLICRYKIVDNDGITPLQSLEQAERHAMAARMEAERQERMAKKDSKLVSALHIQMPTLYRPEEARKIVEVKLNPTVPK
jgi:hypothetical protein